MHTCMYVSASSPGNNTQSCMLINVRLLNNTDERRPHTMTHLHLEQTVYIQYKQKVCIGAQMPAVTHTHIMGTDYLG